MSMKVLAGFASALVVTSVGLFAANGGSVSSLFESDSGPSACGQQSACPMSAMVSASTCPHDEAALTSPGDECPAKPSCCESAK